MSQLISRLAGTYFLTPDMSCVAYLCSSSELLRDLAWRRTEGLIWCFPKPLTLSIRFLLRGSWLFSGDLNLGREGGGRGTERAGPAGAGGLGSSTELSISEAQDSQRAQADGAGRLRGEGHPGGGGTYHDERGWGGGGEEGGLGNAMRDTDMDILESGES